MLLAGFLSSLPLYQFINSGKWTKPEIVSLSDHFAVLRQERSDLSIPTTPIVTSSGSPPNAGVSRNIKVVFFMAASTSRSTAVFSKGSHVGVLNHNFFRDAMGNSPVRISYSAASMKTVLHFFPGSVLVDLYPYSIEHGPDGSMPTVGSTKDFDSAVFARNFNVFYANGYNVAHVGWIGGFNKLISRLIKEGYQVETFELQMPSSPLTVAVVQKPGQQQCVVIREVHAVCMKNADAAAMWAAGMELTALLKGMKLNVTIEELQHLLYINAPPGGRFYSLSRAPSGGPSGTLTIDEKLRIGWIGLGEVRQKTIPEILVGSHVRLSWILAVAQPRRRRLPSSFVT
jgi:hypothetical protein